MSPHEPHEAEPTHAPAWSPETETREDVKALLARRSALTRSEVQTFRILCSDVYDTYFDTLRCVIRSRGATGEIERDLVHDALATFWNEAVETGLPENIQAKLISLASGRARNYVRRESHNPTKEELPNSSMQVPGSFPRPERDFDLKEIAPVLYDRLSAQHKAVIDAVILRDLTVAEAARELKLRRTTAGSRLTAALALLLEMAEEMLTESERCV